MIVVRTEWKVTSEKTRRSARAFVRNVTTSHTRKRRTSSSSARGVLRRKGGRQGQREGARGEGEAALKRVRSELLKGDAQEKADKIQKEKLEGSSQGQAEALKLKAPAKK
jgi:hypothetical protein